MAYQELAHELLNNMLYLSRRRVQRQIDAAVRGEAFILHYLASYSEAVLPGDLGEVMAVSSARIASALNSLEKKGLITRQINTSDRRQILVCLTPEGKLQADQYYHCTIAAISNMLEQLGDQDAMDYVRIISKLVTVLSKMDEAPTQQRN